MKNDIKTKSAGDVVAMRLTPYYVNTVVTSEVVCTGIMIITLLIQVPYFLNMGLRFVSMLQYDQQKNSLQTKCMLVGLAAFITITNIGGLFYNPLYLAIVILPIA